jgi:hypothetical protein
MAPDYSQAGAVPVPAATAAGTAAPAASMAPGGNTSGSDSGLSGQVAAATAGAPGASVPAPGDRIIKTGVIEIQVAGIDDSIIRATDIIHGLGGWSAGSDRSINSGGSIASVTFRIPVSRFDDALSAIRKLGVKVLSEHSDSQSVGGQIVDLQARIDNLKASEKAIQAIMSRANTIGDVLTVQQRLADIQGQIEELSAQLTGLTDQSSFSTLTVIFNVPAVATPTPSPSPSPTPSPTATAVPWTAKDQFDSAAGTLSQVGQAGATVAIWVVVVVLPIGICLLILLLLIALITRFARPYWQRMFPAMPPQSRAEYRPASAGGWQAGGWQGGQPTTPAPIAPAADQPGNGPETPKA